MQSAQLIQTLSDAFGAAGFEDEIRAVIRRQVEDLCDEVHTDVMGNLVAVKKGKTGKRLMLDAHMDEIGLMITFVDENGYLRFTNIGGWDRRVLPAHMVTISTRRGGKVRGVIGAKPPHVQQPDERDKVIKIEDMFIDVGATSAGEVERLGIRVGDPAVLHHPSEMLNENCLLGKALDDRAGCAVIIKVLEKLASETTEMTVLCNFAVCEETGLRGAKTAAFRLEPNIALAFEGTTACDMPGIPAHRQVAKQGEGPAITVADNSIIVNRRLVALLETLAREGGIPCQFKMPSFGGTDAGAIQTSRGGVLAGALSVSCRYIHSAYSTLRIDDFDNTVELAARFVRHCPELLRTPEGE